MTWGRQHEAHPYPSHLPSTGRPGLRTEGMVSWEIRQGDCLDLLRAMPDGSVQCCVTSPPYWGLRDYGQDGQLGLEATPDSYVAGMVAVFSEVRRVLRDDGTLWLNLGDSYAADRGGSHPPAETLAGGKGGKTSTGKRVNRSRKDGYNPSRNARAFGLKHKDLVGVPWLTAFALRADGWYLRSEIIWSKPNPMPESVRDRPTKAHEQVFLLTKNARYFYDADAIRQEHVRTWDEESNGRGLYGGGDNRPNKNNDLPVLPHPKGANKRTVWTVSTQPFGGAHFATFPPNLIEPMILAGSKPGDTILDPFSGSGTTGMVALRHDRSYIGLELNPEYVELSRNRIRDDAPLLNTGIERAAA